MRVDMVMNYKQVKADVLKMYDEFLSLVQGVKGNQDTTYDTTLRKLEKDAGSIREDIFRLMIVGEAKSGKSTFINAYLGKDILPTDVKECTSSIVEIKYGAKYTLKATYADDRVEVIDSEKDIKKFLAENAALDDNWRDIPVGMINLQLIIPSKGKGITEGDIKDLLRIIANDNIYKLEPKEYERKVRKYIEEKLPHWQSIVEKMEIEYPFEDEDLKGIQIVDSPGVNAEGRVGDITNEYIVNANAVMFLKPLVGGALKATSFKKFLETASADRNSNAMFLVLTRAANETFENVERIHMEAYKQFPNINEKQIIHLDSKVEMFRKLVKGMSEEDLQAFMEKQIEENTLDAFLETPWYRSRFQRDVYLEKLAELSNFNKMDEALNLFARKAQYILLSQLLSGMITVLGKIKAEQEEKIKNYKEKAENPIELEAKLESAEERLKDLNLKMHNTLKEIKSKYKDDDGLISRRAAEEMASYRQEINRISPNSSNSVDELEKATFRRVKSFAEFEDEIQKNIVDECNERLEQSSEKVELNYIFLKPALTPEIINEIKTERRKQAEEYTKGNCFKKARSKLNQSRFFDLVKNDIDKRIDTIKDELVVALQEQATNVISAYRNELARNISLQVEEYKRIVEDKATAEEMQAKIKAMEAVVGAVIPMTDEIKKLKGGIDRWLK